MTIKVNVTTIAMYMDFGDYSKWVVDTYCRINPKSKFIENFMKEYAGNGIEKIKIVDEWVNEYPIETLGSFADITTHIRHEFEGLNETILDY